MKKMSIDYKKNNTMKSNVESIERNIKVHQKQGYIEEGYAEYLLSRLELIKPKGHKYEGFEKHRGTEIIDIISNKKYISLRDAERDTGISINEIQDNLNGKTELISKIYKFKKIEGEGK